MDRLHWQLQLGSCNTAGSCRACVDCMRQRTHPHLTCMCLATTCRNIYNLVGRSTDPLEEGHLLVECQVGALPPGRP